MSNHLIEVDAATDKAYLTDFGVSKLAIMTASQTIQQVQGTPAFLLPENLTAQDNSLAGDIYAFGGVLVEHFSEIPIWEGLTPFQIITKETPDTKDLPPGVQTICTQCFKSVQDHPGISEILQFAEYECLDYIMLCSMTQDVLLMTCRLYEVACTCNSSDDDNNS